MHEHESHLLKRTGHGKLRAIFPHQTGLTRSLHSAAMWGSYLRTKFNANAREAMTCCQPTLG